MDLPQAPDASATRPRRTRRIAKKPLRANPIAHPGLQRYIHCVRCCGRCDDGRAWAEHKRRSCRIQRCGTRRRSSGASSLPRSQSSEPPVVQGQGHRISSALASTRGQACAGPWERGQGRGRRGGLARRAGATPARFGPAARARAAGALMPVAMRLPLRPVRSRMSTTGRAAQPTAAANGSWRARGDAPPRCTVPGRVGRRTTEHPVACADLAPRVLGLRWTHA
jgi:hypothetical protein